ncbi:YcaO-like family protein [Neorhizobium sp. NCHU2750]|uniref:YcaO-like family protein n=1 Tax=Neorhizobium sp. NCHU2750 TaxID=1825976 RepID=UPI001FE19464
MIYDPGFLHHFGITRVGDVTGLDVIGMPVWFATRPNSRGLSVAQGKGLTDQQAQLSAIMEAIEGAVAEDTQGHLCDFCSIDALHRRGVRTIPFEGVSRVRSNSIDFSHERAWVEGYSLRHDHAVLAPFELVGLDFRADFPWDRDAFLMSSQGLAAGFDFDRAALHAILELVENDACLLIDALAMQGAATRPIAFARGQSADLDALIEMLEAVYLDARFFDLTGANGIPVVLASIPRILSTEDGPGSRASAGVACRLNMAEAASSALQEAIQSRLTDISGARDDLSPGRYRADRAAPVRGASSSEKPRPVQATNLLPDNKAGPLWRSLAEHLFSCGVSDIYLFPLKTGRADVFVVRALACGMTTANGVESKLNLGALNSILGG